MLKASDLQIKNKNEKLKKNEKYKKLLNYCVNKIKYMNEQGHLQYIFTLNELIIDMPLINVEKALKYISKKLVKNEFKVYKMTENAILIDWSCG
uniref:Uncharacterized protein n=1 Tax=viral metagenome TaxID=1070528 RepID=A0A6C0F622_9ZZZZ|tara:strand:+ start:404 stop:685 length:282 start_codon:yes stop_codon:yes gene_type:complete